MSEVPPDIILYACALRAIPQLTANSWGAVGIDMNTIEDKNYRRDNKVVHHLKDPGFFEVERFPFLTIAITRGGSLNSDIKKVTANLTVNGITHLVTFPVKMEAKNGIVKADGKLVIDRTLWDVRYKSVKFYENLASQIMSDSISRWQQNNKTN